MGSDGENAAVFQLEMLVIDKGDLLAGAWLADPGNLNHAGATYLVHGNSLTQQKFHKKWQGPYVTLQSLEMLIRMETKTY